MIEKAVVKEEVLTVQEACQYLKIARRTLYRYLKNQEIPAFKIGKKEWRFLKSELDNWMREKLKENLKHKE